MPLHVKKIKKGEPVGMIFMVSQKWVVKWEMSVGGSPLQPRYYPVKLEAYL